MTPNTTSASTGGRARSSNVALARNLGYFSLALGVTELLGARTISRALGMGDHRSLIRGYGLREIATGVGILASEDPTPWILGRVAGDALDIGTVVVGLRDGNPKQSNVIVALGTLLGATVIDLVCAQGLLSEKQGGGAGAFNGGGAADQGHTLGQDAQPSQI